MYNLPDVTVMLNIQKIKLLKQLLTNKSTSPRYYWLLSNNDSSAFLSDATYVLRRNNLDIVDVLTGSNLKKIRSSGNDLSRLDDVDCLKKCVTNWQIDLFWKSLCTERTLSETNGHYLSILICFTAHRLLVFGRSSFRFPSCLVNVGTSPPFFFLFFIIVSYYGDTICIFCI